MSRDAAGWIRALGLTPHPEGGHLRETWRSAEQLPASGAPSRFAGPRAVLTEALYLLQSGERSRLHRLRAEEVWHHLDGGALHLHVFTPGGEYRRHVLGRDLEAGESLQVGVPHGCWFGAEPAPGVRFVLSACSVAPGFEFEDLEMGARARLLAEYPAHRDLVMRLTSDEGE